MYKRQGQVCASFQQVDDAVVAVQFQLDLRIKRAKFADQRHDRMQHEGRGGVYAQAPCRCLAAQGHLLLGFLDAGQDAPRLSQEHLTLFGQLQASRGAAQQGNAELFLQATQ